MVFTQGNRKTVGGLQCCVKAREERSQEELAGGGDFWSESQRLARGWLVQLQGKGVLAEVK